MTGLYLVGDSPLHRLAPQVKIVCAIAFVVVVVATPERQWWAFVIYFGLVVAAASAAGLPVLRLSRRMLVEVPFVVFAVLLPFVGSGPQVQWGPLSLSEPGLWAAWNIMAKATIGVAVAVVLAATTAPAESLSGLARLRLPGLLVQIGGFMIRYGELVADELRRMRVAMASRGFTASHVRAWPMVAASLSALFIRTYERGERVHLAMVARGYDGTARGWDVGRPAGAAAWLVGWSLPVVAAGILVVARWA